MSASDFPQPSRIVGALPDAIPFLSPEAIERQIGQPLTLRLGANESLFGPSPKALDAMRRAVASSSLYGDPDSIDLRHAIAARHGISLAQLVIGSGIDELLGLVVQAYTNPGETVVMSTGGYPTFAYHARAHGLRIATTDYIGFLNDPIGLAAACHREKAAIVYLANPDNPTGSWLAPDAIETLAQSLPTNCLMLLDEAYADFLEPALQPSINIETAPVIRFRTFSKAHGLAGLRIGYVFGAPELVRKLDRIRNHFGVNRIAQAAALASLDDPAHLAFVVAATGEARLFYAELGQKLGFQGLPSATNFIAFNVGDAARARHIVQRLAAEHGIFIRMPGTPPLDRCIRITIGPREIWPTLQVGLESVVRHRS